MPSRPIASEAELDQAIAALDVHLDLSVPSPSNKRVISQLSDVIRAYEQQHYPVAPLTPAEQLAYLLDLHGLTVRQLARALGLSYAKLTEVLAGRENFTRTESELLAAHFALDPSAFLAQTSPQVQVTSSAGVGEIRRTTNRLTPQFGARTRSRGVTLAYPWKVTLTLPQR